MIQSAAIFSEGLEFTRQFAFYSVLQNRLPLATVVEPWLKLCLDLIPKDLKSLDVFAVHALAVEVWKIVAHPAPILLRVKVRCRKGIVEIDVPGSWRPGVVAVLAGKKRRGHKRRRRGGGEGGSGGKSAAPPPDGEGSPSPPSPPPPPDPPPPPPPPVAVVPGRYRVRTSNNPFRGLATHPSFARPVKGTGGGKISRKGRGKGKASASAKETLEAKLRGGQLTPKEKARLRKAAKKESKTKRPAEPSKPQAPLHAASQLAPSRDTEFANAERLAADPTPSWSPRAALKGMRQALGRLLDEIRAEMAAKSPEPPAVEKITPDGGQPSDRRNEAKRRAFPAPKGVFRLLPDRVQNATLARTVRRFVPVLRPFFAVLGQEKGLEERLTSGRRLQPGSLVKHLAYGETRLFADQRLADVEQHADVLVCVLIDTSSSTKTDDRSGRAKLVASLVAECLKECPNVESVFLGYNQNVYLCGDHEGHSVGSLAPAGKTNEAAAIDHLRKAHLDAPRRRKAVIVLSDGLPTVCSVESVRWLVHSAEKETGARFLYGALSAVDHPAYRRRADLAGEVNDTRVRALGRQIASLLR